VIYRILCVVLVALTFWWMLRVGEGEREFRQSQQALRHVTSWRQEARVGTQDSEQAVIMCPDRGRWLPYARSRSKDGPANNRNGTTACEKLVRGEYLYPLPDYDHLIEHTRIVKGAVDTVQGMKCQEWTTARIISGRFAPAQPLDSAQICIGLHDHLPRRIKYQNAEYIFYDWNTPIQIEENQAPLP
jgi:hypothetical protein